MPARMTQIRVDQADGQLTISGERRQPAAKNANAAVEGTASSEPVGRRRRTEHSFGRFERKLGKAQMADANLDAVFARWV